MKGGADNARRVTPIILRSDLNLTTKLHALAHLFNSSIFVAVLMLAVTSVAQLPFLDNPRIDTRVYSVSLLGLIGVATVFFTSTSNSYPGLCRCSRSWHLS